jgi:DNA relaxase NicK
MTYLAEQVDPELMVALLKSFCARYIPKRCKWDIISRMRNGFENRFVVYIGADEIGCCAWGGNRGRAQLEFRGRLCSMMRVDDWKLIKWAAVRLQARLTRLDIAFDSYEGELTIERLERAFRASRASVMNFRGKEPVMEFSGCEEKGRTRYISVSGRLNACKVMSVYEKGMQLAGRKLDEDADLDRELEVENRKWLRCELRLKRKKNQFEIPYEVLDSKNWLGYISGFGPLFQSLLPKSADLRFMSTNRATYQEFNTLVRRKVLYEKKQFGKFHFFMIMLLGQELFCRLMADETEEWRELASFPGWETDDTFKDLVSASALPLVNPDLRLDAWNDPENKRVFETEQWFRGNEGALYPHSRIKDRPAFFKLVKGKSMWSE